MDYLVDFNGIEEYKNEIDKNIETIKKELKGIYDLQETVIWSGDAYSVVMDNLNNRLNILSQMTYVLSLLSNFMEVVSNNYQEGIEDIKKNFEEVIEEIKLEKKKKGLIWEEM